MVEEWAKQKNHDLNGVLQLLAVPHYADLLENDTDMAEDKGEPAPLNLKPQSGLVKSCAAWQKEMAKWVQEEQACSNDSDGDDLGDVIYGRQHLKWLP